MKASEAWFEKPASMFCRYAEFGCSALAAVEGCCMIHACLFLWLTHGAFVEGQGDTDADIYVRIEMHDALVELPGRVLETILRAPPWKARLDALFGLVLN